MKPTLNALHYVFIGIVIGCALTLFYHGLSPCHTKVQSETSKDLSPVQPRSKDKDTILLVWVWMNFESPMNTRKTSGLGKLFNVTLNYCWNADIKVRKRLVFSNSEIEEDLPIQKKVTNCWIVTNWNENHYRVKYYQLLSKFITINTYGAHFNNKQISHEEYTSTVASCKFYLSFDNTREHPDYMTEKLFNAMKLGSVPVALGPPRQVYEKFIPGDAFVHVDDFSKPEKLAQYLQSMSEDEYSKLLRWRKLIDVSFLLTIPVERANLSIRNSNTRSQPI